MFAGIAERNWKLYLAVAAHSSLEADAVLGQSKPAGTPGSIQIWSVAPTASLLARERRHYRPKAAPAHQRKPKMGRPSKAKPGAANGEGGTLGRGGRQSKVTTPPTTDDEVSAKAEDGDAEQAFTDAAVESVKMETSAPDESAASVSANEDVAMDDQEAGKEEEGDVADEWELEASLAMVVCVEGGQPCRLQWCPSDSADPVRP